MEEKLLSVANKLHEICKQEGVILLSDGEGTFLRARNADDQDEMCCIYSDGLMFNQEPLVYLDFV